MTGAAGFIGAHLVARLLAAGCLVTAVVRPDSDLWRIEPDLDRLVLVRNDLAGEGPAILASSERAPDVLFHLAAAGVRPGQSTARTILETNVLGTLRLLEDARDMGVSRFVYCGSCFEYPSGTLLREDSLPMPGSEYGASKAGGWLLAHAFARRYGMAVVSVRPFTVYGPMEAPHRLVPFTIGRAIEDKDIELTSGDDTRDFVFVDDVVEAFLIAASSPAAVDGTFNLCTGRSTSVREVVEEVVRLTGCGTPRFGALPSRTADPSGQSGDPSWTREALGWTASTSLRTGLEKTVQWTLEQRSGLGPSRLTTS